jgi:hypothetical protein
MARHKKEADIGAAQRRGEGPDALLHVALAEIDAFDHLEAERLELAAMSAALLLGLMSRGRFS